MPDANTILFGSDPTPGIVAVEPGADSVRLYRRVDGAVVTETRPFRRWILTTERPPLQDAEWTELEGEGYRWLAEFRTRSAYENARQWIRESHADHIAHPSPVRQYLISSGQTLFKGMAFDDPVRMQLDIETIGFDPKQPRHRIILVAISDNRGFETTVEGDEEEILRGVMRVVHERDPDIIEGHNIFGFDLPYLAERARQHGIALALGRDARLAKQPAHPDPVEGSRPATEQQAEHPERVEGSELAFGSRLNCMIGYFSRPYIPVHIHGRQVIDTLFAVQRFDVSRAELSSHGLKAVAVAFGISEPDREIIPLDKIASEWKHNPDRVRTYALQDVRETRSVAALVCPAEFYLTQMIPESYERAATSGTGEKINHLFIREYLRQRHAIPMPPREESGGRRAVPGGYTELRRTGVIRPIVKCDVESLYPSLMLTRKIKPRADVLDVFLPALEELTRRRFEAKRKAKEAKHPERVEGSPSVQSGRERAYWDGLQASFKILINSFYGYLGGSSFNFNDYEAAAQVTTGGQALVKKIVEELERTGSSVIEVDTDGVYFQPPEGVRDEESELAYVERIGDTLTEGIRLAHDGRYRAMISLKMKNYVLEKYNGEKIFRGSALRSRAEEPFLLHFLADMTDCLLRDDPKAAVELYQSIARRIESGELTIEDFARRERVTEKTFTSAGRRRLAKAVTRTPRTPSSRPPAEHPEPVEGALRPTELPELIEAPAPAKVGDYVMVYQRNDGSIALADEYNNDEDRDYLLQKLYKFAGRLREAFGDDFDLLFPDPHKTRGGQQTLELF